MGKTRKVKIEKLDPFVCNMDLSWQDADTIFFSVLVREYSIFRKANEDRARLLKRLWDIVSPNTKYEALWDENFRTKMDMWCISYEQDLIDLDIPEDITDDEDDED